MEKVTNRYITINKHIDGAPQESDFTLKTETLSLKLEPQCSDIIVQVLYVSVDPYQINRMKPSSVSHTAFAASAGIIPGQAIEASGVGRVVASGHSAFQRGDLVVGLLHWGEYSIIKDAQQINKLDPMGFPLSYYVSVFGGSGLTAYCGIFDVCKPREGEKVFVSAASGSVGHLVGQYAKLLGCYVVGCAGSKEKVDLLKEKLGFDDAFNYKEVTDLPSTLKRYFPDGIDIYFDNVGGEMLEAAVANMNSFGRVAVCGAISEYTDRRKRAAPDMLAVIYKRITIQGFLAVDYLHMHADFISKTADYLRTNRMKSVEDISHGIDNVPSAFMALFCGDNIGKKIVQIAEA